MEALGVDIKGKTVKATVAFTLPISCQICLGKVKEPVCCENNHVFCQLCITVWTSKNSFCPTCRVDIKDPTSLRQLRGGQSLDDASCRADFSDSVVRKARVKSLFNSYEEEILRLSEQIEKLQTENIALIQKHKEASSKDLSLSASSDAVVTLTNKLSEVDKLYKQARTQITELKVEKQSLETHNYQLSKENEDLRIKLSHSSPRKGFSSRFTVAALERQIADQKKVISDLEKALTSSDNHIKALMSQIEHLQELNSKSQDNRSNRLSSKNSLQKEKTSTTETLQSSASQCLQVSRYTTKPYTSNQCQTLSATQTSNPSTRKVNQSLHTSPVTDLLVSGVRKSLDSPDILISSESPQKATPTKISNTTPTKRTNSDMTFDLDLPSPGTPLSKIQTSLSKRLCLKSDSPGSSAKLELDDCNITGDSMEESNLAMSDLHDTSVTPEFSDCLRLLNEAEQNVKQRQSFLDSCSSQRKICE